MLEPPLCRAPHVEPGVPQGAHCARETDSRPFRQKTLGRNFSIDMASVIEEWTILKR